MDFICLPFAFLPTDVTELFCTGFQGKNYNVTLVECVQR